MNFNLDELIFYDKSINTNKNNDWIAAYNIIAESGTQGTEIYSNTPQEGFYYINQELDKDLDYMFIFKWIDGHSISPIIQIREKYDMNTLLTFQKNNNHVWQIYSKTSSVNSSPIVDFIGLKNFNKQATYPYDEIKLIKKGNNIKIYCENKLTIEYPVNFHSNFYIGFGGHSFDNRRQIVKDILLKEFKEDEIIQNDITTLKMEIKKLNREIIKRDKFIKETPELSQTDVGRSTKDGRIIYRNWWVGYKSEYEGLLEEYWFTQFIQHRFPTEDYKLNLFSIWNNPYKLKQPVEGKKIFYTAENLNVIHQNFNKEYGRYALDYVDLGMGYDNIKRSNYLRFPYWLTRTVYPKQNPEEIEKLFESWNSLDCQKNKNVAVINSHDKWNTRTVIANSIEKYTNIDYAGSWKRNTNELLTKFNNDKIEYLKQFKFNICAENVVDNGYVTEKIFDAIKSDCIPLYMGGGDPIEPKVLNEKAILRWYPNKDNSDTIELFKNLLTDEKTYSEFKEQNALLDTAPKIAIKKINELEKRIKKLIYD